MDIELVEMYKLLIINNRFDRLNVQKTHFRQPLLKFTVKVISKIQIY